MIEFDKIKRIVEALIFASNVPVPESRIVHIVEELNKTEVNNIIDELNSGYEKNQNSFVITRIGGGFQFITRKQYSNYIQKLFKGRTKPRLSRAALEALAIIAFKQPISRPEIDAIRGVNSDGVVKTLLERSLITITGRSETVGHALLYSTTPEFLQYFGINDISELPKPKEIEELLGSTQEELPFTSEELGEKIGEELSSLDDSETDEVEDSGQTKDSDEKAE